MAVGGLPCQPFTQLRTQSKKGDSGPPQGHSKYSVVFGMFQDYLAKRQPRGFIVEEVLDFMNKAKGGRMRPLWTRSWHWLGTSATASSP